MHVQMHLYRYLYSRAGLIHTANTQKIRAN